MPDDRKSALYALLVGINEYVNSREMPTLGGTGADVRAFEQLLRDKLGVPEANIYALLDQEARRAAILEAFEKHLIGNARAWVEAGRPEPPPAFLFHYSGHGSQAIDETGTEPDGLDETIVPHDSRTEGVYDIKDWELGELVDRLSSHCDNVTIVLDCCHSGSGTRAAAPGVARTRRCPPDLRPQPSRRPPARRGTRGVSGPSDWLESGRHVLVAGCRDLEEAHEHGVREGDRTRWHGALSYFLIRELAAMRPERPQTYRELHERVRYLVNSEYPRQMPQCEGDLDRLVFGGVRPVREALLSVVDKRDGLIWVDGGVAHGLDEGALLNVYPPDTRRLADAGEPIARLEVLEVGAVESGCEPTAAGIDVPLHARVAIYRLDHGDMRRRVLIAAPDEAAAQKLRERLAEADVAPYLEPVEAGAEADFRLELAAGALAIQDAAGELLVAPHAADGLDEAARDLAHLARYRNALELRNTAPHSELAGAVGLEIKALDFDPATQEPIAVDLPVDAGGETLIETGQRVVLAITNRSDQPLYFALLDFGPDWAVYRLYPRRRGAREPLAGGTTHHLGLSRKPREQLQAALPEGLPEGHDTFKVFASIRDASYEVLEQGPLKTPFTRRRRATTRGGEPSALDRLLGQAMDGGRTRAYGPPAAAVEDEWTTAQIRVVTVRKASAREASARVVADQPTAVPGFPIEVQAPAGFRGALRVLTPRQSLRSAGGDAAELQPPPGLAALGDQIAPLGLPATRGAGPQGAVIEIEADADARRRVSTETPIRLRLPQELYGAAEGVLALAYDGSFHYPVGRLSPDRSAVDVEWLPEPEPANEPARRGRRGLGRTLKLYLMTVLGWPEPSLGLHRARFVPSERLDAERASADERAVRFGGGEVRYRELRQGDLKAGERVALFVHGFNSDSPWMVTGPAAFLAASARRGRAPIPRYDHVLTFDYETFNHGIGTNGGKLADALRGAAGLGSDDRIHLDVFAHSMGTVVTRSMVEQHGGDELVDRCFLAGPPNQGTKLAELKRLVPWLATLLLNQAGPAPPALVASWAVKRVSDDAAGPEDLRPGSGFIRDLNGSRRPARVPYFILAGRNRIPDPASGVWQRLCRRIAGGADALFDFVFGDDNDLLISVRSMLSPRDGRYPPELLHTRVVAGNHFDYFNLEEAQEQLLDWLR